MLEQLYPVWVQEVLAPIRTLLVVGHVFPSSVDRVRFACLPLVTGAHPWATNPNCMRMYTRYLQPVQILHIVTSMANSERFIVTLSSSMLHSILLYPIVSNCIVLKYILLVLQTHAAVPVRAKTSWAWQHF